MRPAVGVLALQGGVREHLAALSSLGAAPFAVRRADELARCEALVLPGGESTAISRLLRRCELLEPLRARVADGLPVLGTCAGMVLLADRLVDGADGVESVGGLDVTVRRNAFGRQVDSFEADLDVAGLDETVRAVFIRAPWVEECGPGVEVLASVEGRPVLVRGGAVLAASFHPELTGQTGVHALLLDLL